MRLTWNRSQASRRVLSHHRRCACERDWSCECLWRTYLLQGSVCKGSLTLDRWPSVFTPRQHLHMSTCLPAHLLSSFVSQHIWVFMSEKASRHLPKCLNTMQTSRAGMVLYVDLIWKHSQQCGLYWRPAFLKGIYYLFWARYLMQCSSYSHVTFTSSCHILLIDQKKSEKNTSLLVSTSFV